MIGGASACRANHSDGTAQIRRGPDAGKWPYYRRAEIFVLLALEPFCPLPTQTILCSTLTNMVMSLPDSLGGAVEQIYAVASIIGYGLRDCHRRVLEPA